MRRLPWIAFALVIGLLVVARVARQLTRGRPQAVRSDAIADSAPSAVARRGAPVMGTVLEITVEAVDDGLARRLAERALALARHWDDVLTTWRPEGELARLNAAAGRGEVEISSDLAVALDRMRSLAAATDGAFEPGVGALVAWWRLSAEERAAARRPQPPWSIADLLQGGGRRVRLRAGAVLDAGGIGKGIALDAMAQAVRAGGAAAAFFDFGGSSQLACGHSASGPPQVMLAGLAAGVVHGTVALREASLSTSRSAPPGDRAGSIVDPRNGEPVRPERLVTVVARDATTAEAWSTALVVLGRDGMDAARRAGVEVLFEDSSGVTLTPDFPVFRASARDRGKSAGEVFDVARRQR